MMNKNSPNSYVNRQSSPRLSQNNSTSRLPNISSPRRLDSFAISLRKHLSYSQISPSPKIVTYDTKQGISHSARFTNRKVNPEEARGRRPSFKGKTQRNNGTLLWMSDYANMQEQTKGENYRKSISDNLEHYGKGLLRHSHKNSLICPEKERELLHLHYKLKKQREQVTIRKEERAAAIRFKQLLQRYESI